MACRLHSILYAIAASVTEHLFFCCRLHAVKKSQRKHLCLRLFFEGLVWSLAFLTSHKSSKNLFNKVLMNELLTITQTTHNNLQQSVQTASSFEYCVSHDRYRVKNDDTNKKWWFQQSCKFGRLRWSWLTLVCKRIKEYRGASSSEDSLDTSANDLADSCPNANGSWHHFGMTQHIPTWPNYPLRLPLATLQLVRLKTSPASKVTSNRCLTWTMRNYTTLHPLHSKAEGKRLLPGARNPGLSIDHHCWVATQSSPTTGKRGQACIHHKLPNSPL